MTAPETDKAPVSRDSALPQVAVLTLVGTLVSDLLLGLVDPRVRLGQGVDR